MIEPSEHTITADTTQFDWELKDTFTRTFRISYNNAARKKQRQRRLRRAQRRMRVARVKNRKIKKLRAQLRSLWGGQFGHWSAFQMSETEVARRIEHANEINKELCQRLIDKMYQDLWPEGALAQTGPIVGQFDWQDEINRWQSGAEKVFDGLFPYLDPSGSERRPQPKPCHEIECPPFQDVDLGDIEIIYPSIDTLQHKHTRTRRARGYALDKAWTDEVDDFVMKSRIINIARIRTEPIDLTPGHDFDNPELVAAYRKLFEDDGIELHHTDPIKEKLS